MPEVRTESINIQIMENEKNAYDWPMSKLASELYWWCEFFNIAFFKDQLVPVPVISFEKTKITTLGHYVPNRNSLGLLENININSAHLNRPLWDILATLLHEMTHSWQKLYGKPSKSWFHNKEFHFKMAQHGIFVDNKGAHVGVGDPFVFLVRKHAVQFNHKKNPDGVIEIPVRQKPRRKSKLRKWSCGCTNVRVVVKLEAVCLKCHKKFVLVQE